MTVVHALLRLITALGLVDPSEWSAATVTHGGLVSLVALGIGAGLGVSVVAIALLAATIAGVPTTVPSRPDQRRGRGVVDRATRIAWSHPDAPGHRRPRAPGAIASA